MKNKPILIITGDHKSIFFEILFKSLRLIKFKNPLIFITSAQVFKNQIKKFKIKKNIKIINIKKLNNYKLNNAVFNIISVDYHKDKKNTFLKNSFDIALKILKTGFTNKLVNAPINKSNFLNKKFLGISEYIAHKSNTKKIAMLIYNKDLSVCPLTTHMPIKLVAKKINQRTIKEKVKLINDFYHKNLGYKPIIAITGLNPHCESILKFNEDKKIITPAINSLKKKGYKIKGPLPADTVFLKQNRIKFDVILGMYHDQVLSPLKAIKEYDAINITLGLPFYRISPDHGPNEKMIGQNKSNPLSLINSIKFLDKK